MKRRLLRLGAVIGAVTVSALAVSPAFAAATVSRATAQSLHIAIAGTDVVSQLTTATNDGTPPNVDSSTIPNLATLMPGTNTIGAGVAPQEAGANKDGTSFACAGIAGTGGGIARVGHSSCGLNGQPITLQLGNIHLDLVDLLGPGALTGPLSTALAPLVLPVGTTLDQVVGQVSDQLADTPLGDIGLGGSLSAIEGVCSASPIAAQGDANLANAGGAGVPIGLTVPDGSGGTQDLPLVTLPLNPAPNYHVVAHPTGLTNMLLSPTGAIRTELDNALNGAFADIGGVLQPLLSALQDQVITQLVAALQPVLDQLQANILDITLNKQVSSEGGQKIDVTALDLQVLPAAAQFTGASLVSGQIGHVTCGSNRSSAGADGPCGEVPCCDQLPCDVPNIPTVVDSGMAGHGDHTARNVLGATAALMLLAGTAGLAGYRRMLDK